MTAPSEHPCAPKVLCDALVRADAVIIGAGAGLSAAAGLSYSGARFLRYFADFREKYGIQDMYSGGFFPFPTPEEYWGWWCRHIWHNRYAAEVNDTYDQLLRLVCNKDYFVLTTNVDHLFQLHGFDTQRLFYTQGDYGLWQCQRACHAQTYDNEATVRAMLEAQQGTTVPTSLVPHCPKCGAPMCMNLRIDDTFVEGAGWHRALERYTKFLRRVNGARILLLELGVGYNTPGIIKFPFWEIARSNKNAVYLVINNGRVEIPRDIAPQSLIIEDDIHTVLTRLQRQ